MHVLQPNCPWCGYFENVYKRHVTTHKNNFVTQWYFAMCDVIRWRQSMLTVLRTYKEGTLL